MQHSDKIQKLPPTPLLTTQLLIQLSLFYSAAAHLPVEPSPYYSASAASTAAASYPAAAASPSAALPAAALLSAAPSVTAPSV